MRNGLGWGIFLVFLGLVLLCNSLGLLSWTFWTGALSYWPVYLIVIGVCVIFRLRSWLTFVALIVSVAVIGALVTVGHMPQGGFFTVNIGIPGIGETPDNVYHLDLPGTEGKPLDLAINGAGARFNVRPGSRLSGMMEWAAEPPTVDSTLGETARVVVTAEKASYNRAPKWDIELPTGVPIKLNLDMAGMVGDLDFTGATKQEVTLNVAGGVFSMRFAKAEGYMEANAAGAKMDLYVPEGVALRIVMGNQLTFANNFPEQGLTKSGNEWVTTCPGLCS
jgi:hypothetical protein